MDVEFLVQLLQRKYSRSHPEVFQSNVWEALDALETAGRLPPPEAAALREGYSFLRLVEARLRSVTGRLLTEDPDRPDDLIKLARRLGFEAQSDRTGTEVFLAEFTRVRAEVNRLYDSLTARERAAV